MEVVKFRAWCEPEKQYYYIDLWKQLHDDGLYIPEESEGKFVIEQYIGCKDRNSEEIYDGDIVDPHDFNGSAPMPVIWDVENAMWYLEGFDPCGDAGSYDRCDWTVDWEKVERVGNIHDT